MEEKQLGLEECIEMKSKMQSLIEQMYVTFDKNSIEYAQSAYNSARLEDFIKLYQESKKYENEDPIKVMINLNQ